MKKRGLLFTLLLCLLLAACAPAATPAAPAEEAPGQTSGRCGDTSQLSSDLTLYNWVEYIDPDIITQFAEECGVTVTETNYDSNETLLAQLQAGGANYDVIVPSDYMVQLMVDEDLLEPLDFNVITNISNMGDTFTNQYFDPNQQFTVPYFWGTSGYAVDTSVVPNPVASWEPIFNPPPELCGKISMLDDQRETIGAALMYLGYSINDVDPAHLEEAKNLLIAQAPCVKAYDSQTNDDLIIQGETAMAHIWTGDAILAGSVDTGGRDEIVYEIPVEGTTIWQDNMAVPRTAQNKYTAMVFINYLADPEVAAQNAEYVGYGSPNEAARAFIDPDLLANESVYPPEDVMMHLQWIEDVGPALELYDRVWTEFKAAIGG